MRQDLQSPNLFDAILKSARLSHARHVLAANEVLTNNGPLVNFLDPNGAHRDVALPANDEGLFYVISNVGVGFNLLVKNAAGVLQATVQPTQTLQIWSSETEWQGTKATTNLDVFTNTVDGLVPAPNSGVPGSLFLRDDGQWGQVQVVGIVDAFKYMSDGTNIAVGAGPDTFTFRSSTNKVGITVTNNEAVFGDNVNLTVLEAAVDHDALLNFVANEHIDHTSISISAGIGLTGGGTIAANRTLALDINGLGVIAPVLGDSLAFYDLSGTTHGKTTFTILNGILNHDGLLNYVADQHIAHSGVSIIAGTGLSGGGSIAASRTLNLNINGLTTDTIATADEFAFYDDSGADHNKITFGNLVASIDHNSLLNYSANCHIDHTAVSITGTGMLAGGGNIDASRTITLAASAAATVLANITGGSAVPTANTITQFLDAMIGSTRGMIAVRGAATWGSLALGVSGRVLSSDGTDAVWQAVAGTGDVVGPASATNSGFAKFDGTTGKLIKNSAATIAIADGGTGQVTAAAGFDALKQAATTAYVGAVELAIESEMETGTDTGRVPSVSVMQHHKGVSKAWAYLTNSGGTYTLQDSYNVPSFSDDGVGLITLTIGTDFASANWSSTFGSESGGSFLNAQNSSKTTGVVTSDLRNYLNANVDGNMNFAAHGQQ